MIGEIKALERELTPDEASKKFEKIYPDIAAQKQTAINADSPIIGTDLRPIVYERANFEGVTDRFNWQMAETGYDRECSWLIKHFIPAKATGMLYGFSGTFKSFQAISIAASVATGRPWNGKKVTQTGVLYIVGEGGVGVPQRVKAWTNAYNDGQPIKNLITISHPVYFAHPVQPLALANTISDIERDQRMRIGLVVIDTLSQCFGGGDENASKDMGGFLAGINKVRKYFDTTVLIVHHTKKDGTEPRGSSALPFNIDFVYKTERRGEDGCRDMTQILRCNKMKDAAEPEPTAFDVTEHYLRKDSDGDDVTSLVMSTEGYEPPPEDDKEDQYRTGNHRSIISSLQRLDPQGKGIHKKAVIEDLKSTGVNTNQFSRWVKKLVEDGAITIDGDLLKIA